MSMCAFLRQSGSKCWRVVCFHCANSSLLFAKMLLKTQESNSPVPNAYSISCSTMLERGYIPIFKPKLNRESQMDDTMENKVKDASSLTAYRRPLHRGGGSERLIYANIPFRSFAFSDSSRPRIDSLPPATIRIDDFVRVEDTPPVNENVISERKTAYERKILPPELKHNRNVVTLTCKSTADGGICDVYLVGTNHVSSVGSKHEVHGGEFYVAYDEAMKYGGKVIPGDRSEEITLRRMWAKMSLWQKTLFVPGFLLVLSIVSIIPYSETFTKMVEENDENDDLLDEVLSEHRFPIVVETALLHERDQYMSAKLLEVAREHNSVVAVVGKGHLVGIRKNWGKPVDVKQLLEMPSVKHPIPVGKIVAGVAIVYGLYLYINK